MVGDAEVLKPEVDRGACHLDQGILPVARRGVAVEGTSQVAPFDQLGQLTGLRCGDLPLVLAKLGRDEIESERLVELLLVMDLRRLSGALGLAGGCEAVFVERPTSVQGAAAETDVVFLASGKIDEGEGKLFGLHHAKVALDPILETDA